MYELAVEILKLLATPTGAVSLVAALLAGGIAIREYRTAKRNGKRFLPGSPGEHTGELQKDLAALAAQPPAAEEVAIVRAALAVLEQRITGPRGIQERVAIVEDTCARTEQKVDALPAKMDAQLRSQTVEIRTHLSQEVFRAVRGLHDELAEETDAKISAAVQAQAPATKEPGA